jgi:hypothetical protein
MLNTAVSVETDCLEKQQLVYLDNDSFTKKQ